MEVLPIGGTNYWRYYLLEVLLIGGTTYWKYHLFEVLLIRGTGSTTYWRYYLLDVLSIGSNTYWRYYSGNCLQDFCKEGEFPARNLNPGPSECEAEVLPARPRGSAKLYGSLLPGTTTECPLATTNECLCRLLAKRKVEITALVRD